MHMTLPPSKTRWCSTAARYLEPLPTSRMRAPMLRYGKRCSDTYACYIGKQKTVNLILKDGGEADRVGSTDCHPVPMSYRVDDRKESKRTRSPFKTMFSQTQFSSSSRNSDLQAWLHHQEEQQHIGLTVQPHASHSQH